MLAGMHDHRSYPPVEWAEVCLWIAQHRPDLDARLSAGVPAARDQSGDLPAERQPTDHAPSVDLR